jgi:hypothetical protein
VKNTDVARAFVHRQEAKSKNAKTDGNAYYLFGNKIAEHQSDGRILCNWCGYYTNSTSTHFGMIVRALGRKAEALMPRGKASEMGIKDFYL